MRFLSTTGSHLAARSGTSIHISEVAKNALITTLTLGLAGICSPKRPAERRIQATNAGRGTAETPTHIGDASDFT
jgi:hypothetical protein